MRKFVTYVLTKLGKYFIGFYEYAYKFDKALLESLIEKLKKKKKKKK